VDILKIDRALIKNIVKDPVDQALVKAINDIGQVLKMKTVAGFVEDDATLVTLRKIGVNFVQGYAIGRPQPLAENYHNHSC
jgi:EAL domain-containing protein (putative c-di-GMP-specific phosphodiesterase class I)